MYRMFYALATKAGRSSQYDELPLIMINARGTYRTNLHYS